MTDIARESALHILNTFGTKDVTLDLVMNDFNQKKTVHDRRDMALLNALVYGVLRWRGRIDHIIAHFSKTPLPKINPEIMNTLRLGVYQLLFMDKIPDSAAVNTSVELAKKKTEHAWVVKFVNGILRNVGRNKDSIPFPDPGKDKVKHIAVTRSFPVWIVQKWLSRFGYDDTVRLCDAMNEIPEISVRVNTLKTDRQTLFDSLIPHVRDISISRYAPCGISFTHPDKAVHLFDAFTDGWFQVQDEAAQLVTEIMDPQPGERILDACAGLGGKTGHIAQKMENKGEIIAVDHDPKKLDSLDREMNRLGVTIVGTMPVDLNETIDPKKLGMFDRILLDAPCSGMGVIRRNPDSKWNTSKNNLNRYKKRQIAFLSSLAAHLKPGGVLVYSVCSMEPEENEAVVDSFLHKHPEFHIDLTDHGSLIQNASLSLLKNQRHFYASFPHLHRMDGFFIACLKRKTA